MPALDANHLSELGYGSPAGIRLRNRLLASEEATTIVCVEEQLRGWLAEIHRLSSPHRQIPAYERPFAGANCILRRVAGFTMTYKKSDYFEWRLDHKSGYTLFPAKATPALDADNGISRRIFFQPGNPRQRQLSHRSRVGSQLDNADVCR